MGGIDHGLVAQGQQLAVETVKQQACNLLAPLRIEIGAADVGDEQRVASEDAQRALARFEMREGDGDGVVGVPGRRKGPQADRADLKDLPFLDRLGVGHRVVRAVPAPDRSPGAPRKLAGP